MFDRVVGATIRDDDVLALRCREIGRLDRIWEPHQLSRRLCVGITMLSSSTVLSEPSAAEVATFSALSSLKE